MHAPIIFIHQGDSRYLRFTLAAARGSNPDKEVVLLGDASNRRYAATNRVTHADLTAFSSGLKIQRFERRFQFIAGHDFEKRTYGRPWTHFNFLKWFIVENFLESRAADAFWLFDSDVLVLSRLADLEELYRDCEYTVNNDAMHQLSGYSGSRDVVSRFTNKILDLFSNETYLTEQRRVMTDHPGWGFTMMRAFQAFHEEERTKTRVIFRTDPAVSDSTFVVLRDPPQGLESRSAGPDRWLRLWLDSAGGLYARRTRDGGYVRLAAVNMSWIDEAQMARLFDATIGSSGRTPRGAREDAQLRELDLTLPLGARLRNGIARAVGILRRRSGAG